MVLEPLKVQRVRELLATGQYSQRQIATDAGVSRGSVQRIQHGQRRRRADEEPAEELLDEEDRGSPYDRPMAKCAECGCRCTVPCVACRARAEGEKGREGEGESEEEADFRLRLAGEERARYEAVRDARQGDKETGRQGDGDAA